MRDISFGCPKEMWISMEPSNRGKWGIKSESFASYETGCWESLVNPIDEQIFTVLS